MANYIQNYDILFIEISYLLTDYLGFEYTISTYLRHVITKGDYNQAKHQYPYRKYVSIFNASECGENKDKLNMFLNEEQNGEILNYRRDLVKKS